MPHYDSHDASKITSGTIADARLPVGPYVQDDRNNSTLPSAVPRRVRWDFKTASAQGLTADTPTGGLGFHGALTWWPWTDTSGGQAYQIDFNTDEKRLGVRISTSASAWGAWDYLWHTGWNTKTGDPTGFVDPANIVVSYNSTTRIITLTHASGSIEYFFKGVLKRLASPWTSTAHTDTTDKYYLSTTDGTNFTWSTSSWNFYAMQVAVVGNNKLFALREVHGCNLSSSAHQIIHELLGTYLQPSSGGGLVAGTFALSPASPTDANNTPSFAACTLMDEDLPTVISLWPEGSYTRAYPSGSGTVNLETAQANPLRTGTNYPYYYLWNGSTFTQTEMSGSRYAKVYVFNLPVSSDSNSQTYRKIVVPPQNQYNSQASADAEDVASMYYSWLDGLSPEGVFVEHYTIHTNSSYTSTGKYRIVNSGILKGSRNSQILVAGSASVNSNQISTTAYDDLTQLTLQPMLEQLADLRVKKSGIGGFAIGSDADGDLYYRSGGNLVRLAKPTAGDGTYYLQWTGSVPSYKLDTSYAGTFVKDVFSGNASTTDFTLSGSPAGVNNLFVDISGVLQKPTTDYTLSGTTLSFTSAPPSGTNNITVRWADVYQSKLTSDKTVNLTNSMSASDIQTLVDSQPKNLNGYTLTFQFGDGTYNLSSSLSFLGFVGGAVNLRGKSGEDILSTTKTVILNVTGTRAIRVAYCNVLRVYGIDLRSSTDANYYEGPIYAENSTRLAVIGCVLKSTAGTKTTNCGLFAITIGSAYVADTYVDNAYVGLYFVGCGQGQVSNNGYTGTQPSYGMKADACDVYVTGTTHVTGSVGNYQHSSAGSFHYIEESLMEDRTVSLTSSMTATDIQNLISIQPKNLNGKTLTFQFADGTYTLDASLIFQDFYGGNVNVYGKSTDNTLSTTKSVVLNFSSTYGLRAIRCPRIDINYVKVTHAEGGPGIQFLSCVHGAANYNYILGSGITSTSSSGILSQYGSCYTTGNYVSNEYYGLTSSVGILYSSNNPSTGTNPKYGLYASAGGRIGKNSTQPTGQTANELTSTGGEIT